VAGERYTSLRGGESVGELTTGDYIYEQYAEMWEKDGSGLGAENVIPVADVVLPDYGISIPIPDDIRDILSDGENSDETRASVFDDWLRGELDERDIEYDLDEIDMYLESLGFKYE
jgi:hypothetical protein